MRAKARGWLPLRRREGRRPQPAAAEALPRLNTGALSAGWLHGLSLAHQGVAKRGCGQGGG